MGDKQAIVIALLIGCAAEAGVMVIVNGFIYAPFAAPGDWKAAYLGGCGPCVSSR